MNINKGILFRFEEKIGNGTLYIFDMNKQKIYKGGRKEYDLIQDIKSGTILKESIRFSVATKKNSLYKR